MEKSAVISNCGKYRYVLTRTWGNGIRNKAVFIMLNPSTADAEKDDPTIRRCIGMAKSMNCVGIKVVNLFAVRATSPVDMKKASDPVGEKNHEYVERALFAIDADPRLLKGPIICAWGVHGGYMDQDETMMGWIDWRNPYCLGRTKAGFPRHPLYVRNDFILMPYEGRTHDH